MKAFILFSIFLLSFTFAFSQQRNIDSLEHLLKTDKEDTVRVKHLNAIAKAFYRRNPDSVILFAQQANKLAIKIGWPLGEARAYQIAGVGYCMKDDYLNALDYCLKSLKMYEEQGKKKELGTVYICLGNVYILQSDYPKSLGYYTKAMKIEEELGDKSGLCTTLGNIGGVYGYEDSSQEALNYYLKASKIAQETGDSGALARNYGNIGLVYYKQDHFSDALNYYFKALKMNEEFRFKGEMAIDFHNIGLVYASIRKFKEAQKYFNKALALESASGNQSTLLQTEENLSQLYDTLGRYKLALLFYKKAMAIKDTLFNVEKNKAETRQEMTYQFEKKEAVEKAEQDKKDALQKIFNWLGTLITIIIALIAFIIYRSWKTAKKEKIMAEKEMLLMELKALRTQMNPHFIFNAINSIQNFILDNDQDAAQRHLSRFSKLMRMVLENSGYENIPLASEIKMLELYLEFETVRFSSRFSYRIITDDSIDRDNTFISPLIIQPYVENAIWHGLMHLKNRIGEVVIHFEKQNNQLKCTIDDNGIGRTRSLEMKKDSVHKSMGLSISAERLEIINSLFKSKMSVTFTDKINADGTAAGTKVELLMPLITNERN